MQRSRLITAGRTWLPRVIAAVQSVAASSERGVADYAAAINDALDKSSKPTALIGIGPLLRKIEARKIGGVHVTIEGPPQ